MPAKFGDSQSSPHMEARSRAERLLKAAARKLRRTSEGWLLATPRGQILFQPASTHLSNPTAWEAQEAGFNTTKNKRGYHLEIPANSWNERKLVLARLAASGGRAERRPPAERLTSLLRANNIEVELEEGKPVPVDRDDLWVMSQAFGLSLSARGVGVVNFFQDRTDFAKPSAEEDQVAATGNPHQTIRAPADSELERQLFTLRLSRVGTSKVAQSHPFRPSPVLDATSKFLFAAPDSEAELTLFDLENDAVAIRHRVSRLATIRPTYARCGKTKIEGDFLSPGPHWRQLESRIKARLHQPPPVKAKTVLPVVEAPKLYEQMEELLPH